MADRKIDMSPEAVAARLEEVRALYKLTMSLGEAVILGRTEERRLSNPWPAPGSDGQR